MADSAENDRNLLFGAIAVRSDLITPDQFAEAHSTWSMRKLRSSEAASLPEILCEKGWLLPDDLPHIEYLLRRKLAQYHGDVTASLGDYSAQLRNVVSSIGEQTIDSAASAEGESIALESGHGAAMAVGKAGGRYLLSTLHAAGGIGEIWLARDADLHRDVAVKKLKSRKSGSEVAKRRFLREARITGQLNHPGVVPIYEICLDEATGQPYYSMRFLKGRTLTEAVKEYHEHRRSDGSDPQAFLGLLGAFGIVCNTIAYAHSNGIIHRDLKCENVILGDYGEVIVIDWGLAKELNSEEGREAEAADQHDLDSASAIATQAGHVLGTPSYMAPEQAAGRSELVGPKTDVYGLCAILYEILCGQPPFVGSNVLEVMQRVQFATPIPPSELVAGIPETLEQICLQGLAKSPADRHASAEGLAKAVQGWVSDLAERRQSEEERERFFALSLDLLAIVDQEGHLRQVSPAWERLLGYDREKVVDRPFVELIYAEDSRSVTEHLEAAAKGQTVSMFEARALHSDGSYRWLSWNVTPIAKERSLYIVGRDITELKQSQQLFEGVLQSAPDAMVLVDRRGQIVMVNRQTERIFGYGQDEMLGQSIEMLVPERYRAQHPAQVARFFDSSSVRPMGSGAPLRAVRKDGQEFIAEVALSPIYTETGKLVAASVRDVSARPSTCDSATTAVTAVAAELR